MLIPNKELKNGFTMPVFGIGTWQMGGRFERNASNNDQADILAVQNAIEAGITHIDTAEKYAEGYAEIIIGKAIKKFDRKKLFIVSKVDKANLTYEGIIKSAKNSLNRLGTEYLDLYLIHMPNPKISIKESMKAMDYLIDQGLAKNIGVSNFTIDRFEEAQSYTRNKIVANQLHYNLIFREVERKGLVNYCQENDVMLIAWRPVQKGLLTKRGTEILDEMCDKYHKTPAQIAINWLIAQKNVVTLSKMGNSEHLKENLGALGWEMQKNDIDRLMVEFPNQEDVSDAVPLI